MGGVNEIILLGLCTVHLHRKVINPRLIHVYACGIVFCAALAPNFNLKVK